MSEAMSLACTDCKELLWVGQFGVGGGFSLYTGEWETMEALRRFLWVHRSPGHGLIFDAKQVLEGFAEVVAEKDGRLLLASWVETPDGEEERLETPLGNMKGDCEYGRS